MRAHVIAVPCKFYPTSYEVAYPHKDLWKFEIDVPNVPSLDAEVKRLIADNTLPEGQEAIIDVRVQRGSRKVNGFDKWEYESREARKSRNTP